MLPALAGVALILAGLYFFAASNYALQRLILPRLSKALDAEVTAESGSLHPFSSLILHGVAVKARAPRSTLHAQTLTARYHLLPILRGNLKIDEINLASPNLEIAQTPAEKGPRKAKGPKVAKKPGHPSKPAKTPNLEIGRIRIENAKVTLTSGSSTATMLTELSQLNLTLESLGNGKSGKLSFSAAGRQEVSPSTQDGAKGLARAEISGNFTFTLNAQLQPVNLQGAATMDISQAQGSFADLLATKLQVQAEITPAEIREVALRFEKSGKPLGQVRLYGSLNLGAREGQLNLELFSIDRQVLNLAAAGKGWDFNQSAVNATNRLTLSEHGANLSALGQIALQKFSVTERGSNTPPVDLRADYDMSFDRKTRVLQLRAANLHGMQQNQEFLTASLTRPMTLSFSGAAPQADESLFQLKVEKLRVQDWRYFLGRLADRGTLDATLAAKVRKGGRQVDFDLTGRGRGLRLQSGTNILEASNLELNSQTACAFATNGMNAQGQFSITNLNGRTGHSQFKDHHLAAQYDFTTAGQKLTLSRLNLTLGQAGQPGGSIQLQGELDRDAKNASGRFTASNLNERALGPLLAALLPEKTVTSALLNGGGAVNYHPQGKSDFKGDLQLSNLVVPDEQGKAIAPLAASLKVEAESDAKKLTFHQADLKLSPTSRAGKSSLSLGGTIDLASDRPRNGHLVLTSEALDISPFYDLYSPPAKPDKPEKTSKRKARRTAEDKPDQPASEPPRLAAPFGQLDLEVNVAKLFVRDLEVENFTAKAEMKGFKLAVKPFSLNINRHPVRGTLNCNLGVTGYQYDVALSAERVPLQPLANVFSQEAAGRYQGDLDFDTQLQGAGLTGPSLQKNLAGHFKAAFTNANIQMVGPKVQNLLVPISTVLRLPELAETSVRWLNLDTAVGKGNIDVKQLIVAADAFQASSKGTIPIAKVFTNSHLNLPVSFDLNRSLAQKAGLASGSADEAFVKLPEFLRLTGTLGDPKTKLDNKVVAGLFLKSASSLQVGGDKTSDLLGELGGVLSKEKKGSSGKGKSTNQAPSTNAIVPNILDLLRKK